MPQPLSALFYFMSVQKRFYNGNGCHYIVIKEDEGLINITCFNDGQNQNVILFDQFFDDETALELSREIYHTIKNLRKDGGRNER